MRWVGGRCSQVGVGPPWIVLWPGTPHARLLLRKEWEPLKQEREADFSRVPRTSGQVCFPCDWIRPFAPMERINRAGRLCAAPVWTDQGVVAILGFPFERDAMPEIEAVATEFASALKLLHQVETMRSRLLLLEDCLDTPDLAVAFADARGDVLAATKEGERILGTIANPSYRFLRDTRLLKLSSTICEALQAGSSQVRVSEKCTVTIQPLKEKALSTLIPAFRVEALSEPDEEIAIRIPTSRLTGCEKEVYELVVAGLSNREIAAKRGCSVSTVRHQLAAVFSKTGIHERKALILAHYRQATFRFQVPPLAPPKTDHHFPITR